MIRRPAQPGPTTPTEETDAVAGRRAVLAVGLAAGLTAAVPARADDEEDAVRAARPQAGDLLVFMFGDNEGKVISPADVPLGGPSVLAWPLDPATKTPRDGSRLNQILLVRLDPATMEERVRARAVDGILAYSAVCTHQACTVTEWVEDRHVFHCACHNSEYDPAQGAKVVFGPAPRALAALPLKIVDGTLTVAGPFLGRVGQQMS